EDVEAAGEGRAPPFLREVRQPAHEAGDRLLVAAQVDEPRLRLERPALGVVGVRRHVDDARRAPPPALAGVAALGVVLDESGLREDPEVVARRAARLAEI